MAEFILKVPSSQKASDWFNFIRESLEYTEEVSNLIVDFNDIKFMDTDDFVILACLIESFYVNGSNVNFIGGTENFNNHLYNIKFKKYWEKGFNRTNFTLSHNKTTLCLWKISKDMIYSYSMYARQYFEKLTENKDLISLSSNMDEVFNNVFDHSESAVKGYIITQYYPKNKKISFSVCDFGIGIPTCMRRANINKINVKEDWKAILSALEEGTSAKSTPRNRGFGLNNILEFTENSKGRLYIVSNNGMVEKEAGKMYRVGNTDYHFRGTLI